MGPQTDRPSSASGLQARLWSRVSQEWSGGRNLQLFKGLHNTIFGGDLFLRKTVAAVVTAVVLVVGLEDSNHIPALCLLQLRVWMLNFLHKRSNKMETKMHERIIFPLNIRGMNNRLVLCFLRDPMERWNKTTWCNVTIPVAVGNLLRQYMHVPTVICTHTWAVYMSAPIKVSQCPSLFFHLFLLFLRALCIFGAKISISRDKPG